MTKVVPCSHSVLHNQVTINLIVKLIVKTVGKKKPMIYMGFSHFLAEQAGFEPAVGLTPRTLSRRVT